MIGKRLNEKLFALFWLIAVLISCNNPMKEKIQGNWIINSMNRNSENILHTLGINMITFDKSGDCSFARTEEDSLGSGIWYIKKDTLVIEGGKSPFSGKYLVDLETVDGRLNIHLRSSHLDIRAGKMWSQP